MNYRLTRPIAPIHEAIADNIAYKGPTATIILTAWIVAAAFWPAVRIPFEPGRWALAIVAIVLAAAIRFLNGYATGLLAFWTTRATALVELQFGISLFLSGRIAPLVAASAATLTRVAAVSLVSVRRCRSRCRCSRVRSPRPRSTRAALPAR